VYAGGLVGRREYGDIQHCAALGETVIAKSTGTRRAARIYGDPTGNIGEGNFALSVMKLGSYGAYYDPLTPAPVSDDSTDPENTPNGKKAEPGTGSGALSNANFWPTIMGFGSEWSMSGIARGYPKLANVGGQ
jgi:hypothetical protein